MGYDGVKYSSSLSESGRNIVLFNPAKAKANNSAVYSIPSVLYYAHNIFEDKKLLPKSITDEFSIEEIEYFFKRLKNQKES